MKRHNMQAMTGKEKEITTTTTITETTRTSTAEIETTSVVILAQITEEVNKAGTTSRERDSTKGHRHQHQYQFQGEVIDHQSNVTNVVRKDISVQIVHNRQRCATIVERRVT